MSTILNVLREKTEDPSIETISEGLEKALDGGGSGGGGVLVVTMTYDAEAGTYTLNKTWQEIHDADFAVLSAEINDVETGEIVVQKSPVSVIAYSTNDVYYLNSIDAPSFIYSTDSSSGYPVHTENSGGGGDN